MAPPPALPRIWIVTNPEHPDGPVAPVVRALLGGQPGLVGVQLRAPGASDRELVAWGRTLRRATHDAGAVLTVNRRADVAQIVTADGVHLPEQGLEPNRIRSEWPELGLIGVSRHDREGVERAQSEGASFAFLSPVFHVPGKGEPIGLDGFQQAIAGVGIPTYGLGGIGPEHLQPLIAAGARGAAVRRAVYQANDPAAALRAFLRKLDNRTSYEE